MYCIVFPVLLDRLQFICVCGALVLRWTDTSDGRRFAVQVAFQLRIRPGTYSIGQHTFGEEWTKPFDDTGNYSNNEVSLPRHLIRVC